jgi:hypothetical protein
VNDDYTVRFDWWLAELLKLRDEPDYERQRALIEATAHYLARADALIDMATRGGEE